MAARATKLRKGARLSRGERVARVALTLLVAALGYGALTFSLAQVMVRTNLERAQQLAPYDGAITGWLAAKLAGPDATSADRLQGDRLARLALRRDPTAMGAVVALGLNAQVRSDIRKARRFFTYSEQLSRRDAATQLWTIEDAVARGNIAGAMHHYDIALRIRPGLGEVLFPVLIAASSEQAIRRQLVRTLAAKAPWSDSFIDYASGNGKDPRVVAGLFSALQRAGVQISQTASATVIKALLSSTEPAEAWRYYASVRPGSQQFRSRDPDFAAKLQTPSPFDWNAVDENGAASTIEPGSFEFTIPASVGGPLLQQVQLLQPGTYQLQGQSDGVDQSADSQPYWALVCRDGKELGRVSIPNSTRAGGKFEGLFHVPADCPVQTLVLVARPSEAVAGLSGRIRRVELVPLR